LQAIDLETYLPGDILVKVDRATMAYSLESRCPWLDHRLAEVAGQLPATFKIQGSSCKHIFKHVMAPLIPEGTVRRAKMGFGVPMAEWLRTSLRTVFETTVLRGETEKYLSSAAVGRLWREHLSGKVNHDRKLWNLLMLMAWDGYHLERRPVEVENVDAVAF
jgi:asparagine synthase (glutamine-hydrolysing)